jgi:hypothetical protein
MLYCSSYDGFKVEFHDMHQQSAPGWLFVNPSSSIAVFR